MGMGSSNDLRASTVDMAMNGKGGSVQYALTFDHLPIVINPNQVRHTNLLERSTHGVHPEGFRVNGVSNCNMTRDTLIKTKLSKNS